MKVKKICHISIVHKKNDIRIFHKQCITLVNQAYSVTYISPGNHDEIKEGVHLKGFNYNRKWGKLYRIAFLGKKIIKMALNENADIYQIHDSELIRYVKLLKKKKCKVVYDSHENTPLQIIEKEWIPVIFRKFISRLVDIIEIKNSKYCDLIIVVADSTFDRFNKNNVNTIKVENLPIKKEFSNIKIDYNYKDNSNTFCYSGTIWKERGLINTCFSFKGLDNAFLKIIGRIDIENLSNFLIGLPKNVEFLGYQSREKVFKIYEKSICGICLFLPYPNNMTDPPTKIYEYMASGIPVICSNFDSMESIVLKYNCGISVDPTNDKQIIKAIEYIVNNKDFARKMGQNGLRAIKDNLNWEKHNKILIDAYKEL